MSLVRPSAPESETRADAAIPEVWADLLAGRTPGLHELLAAAVVSRVGSLPDAARIAGFLEGLAPPVHLETERTSETHPGIRGPSIFPSRKGTPGEEAG